jgi:hypothetical protein
MGRRARCATIRAVSPAQAADQREPAQGRCVIHRGQARIWTRTIGPLADADRRAAVDASKSEAVRRLATPSNSRRPYGHGCHNRPRGVFTTARQPSPVAADPILERTSEPSALQHGSQALCALNRAIFQQLARAASRHHERVLGPWHGPWHWYTPQFKATDGDLRRRLRRRNSRAATRPTVTGTEDRFTTSGTRCHRQSIFSEARRFGEASDLPPTGWRPPGGRPRCAAASGLLRAARFKPDERRRIADPGSRIKRRAPHMAQPGRRIAWRPLTGCSAASISAFPFNKRPSDEFAHNNLGLGQYARGRAW